MEETSEPQTWRSLLGSIIHTTSERRRIANALGVTPITLVRWVRRDSNPSQRHLSRLLEVVPQHRAMMRALLAEEFEDIELSPTSSNAIDVSLYAAVLDLYTTTSDELRFWTISTFVLRHALNQFDPDRLGLEVSVIECMAPSPGNPVRCLRERVGLGTPPWREEVGVKGELLGAESLAGYAISSAHLQLIANLSREQRLPTHLPEHAVSAVAAPIRHGGRVAGCLLVVSTQPNYFGNPAIYNLVQNYATILALAFHPQDFYMQEEIALAVMPSPQIQKPYLATFQQRVMAMLKKGVLDQRPISYTEAERRAWWQVEEELLRL
jgi:hypothetical protein